MSALANESYSENHPPSELANYSASITSLPSVQKGKIVETVIQELEKMDQEKITKGWKAVRFLIDYNRHLVEYIAKGYYYYFGGGKISHEELISEGISSLPKAIEKFDLNSKNQFCTYANF